MASGLPSINSTVSSGVSGLDTATNGGYRPGPGVEKAAAEIKEGAGTGYYETVARACLRLVEDGTIDLSPASVN
ncbi:MAG: hypothetical protein ACE37N_13980 [Pseudohongiellaceae bacterium]